MELSGITWSGPPIDDAEIAAELPRELRAVLGAVNGFILFGGALHVRGAVQDPPWHFLRHAWRGAESLAALYPALPPDDVPFAQDCVGDQFLLRGGSVLRLQAETGEVEDVGRSLFAFLERACADPEGSLSPEPLLRHRRRGRWRRGCCCTRIRRSERRRRRAACRSGRCPRWSSSASTPTSRGRSRT